MNGSGCKTCPVKPCHTLHYRGSYSAEQRAKFGLGDPQTNADRIRKMTDEELCSFMSSFNICDTRSNQQCKFMFLADCQQCLMAWLQQPVEVGNGQSNNQK